MQWDDHTCMLRVSVLVRCSDRGHHSVGAGGDELCEVQWDGGNIRCQGFSVLHIFFRSPEGDFVTRDLTPVALSGSQRLVGMEKKGGEKRFLVTYSL